MENILLYLLTYLTLTSLAAERFTEILKRTLLSRLSVPGVVYQILSGLFGAGLAYLSPPNLGSFNLNLYVMCAVVGLAVSAGSGLWNSILGIANEHSKNVKALKE